MSRISNNKKIAGTYSEQRFIIISVAILIVLAILTLGTLYSCMGRTDDEPKPATAEELKAYIEAHPAAENVSCVEDVLRAWKLPTFEKNLLLGVEQCYSLYYYKELPPKAELAYLTAMHFIDNEYANIDKSNPTLVAYALIDSYIAVIGDPYSYYRTAEEFEDYETDMSGKFAGIGVSVETALKDGGIVVINAIDGSPAHAAGILPGDLIVGVAGQRVSELGYEPSVNLIKGEIGTEVTITVRRNGAEFDLTIVRALVTEQTVSFAMLENDIAYIRISSFKANTAEQFIEAIDAAEGEGAKGIIFDVRNNPGGYLTAICNSLSYLVPTDTPLASFSSDKTEMKAMHGTELEPEDHVLTIPSVVICNRYTASAGELFTAALRDFVKMDLIDAVTVGETTYKKGVMQSTFTYQSGAALTLTTAYYNPPLGINYDGVGVVPDIQLSEDTDFLTAAYDKMLAILSAASGGSN